MKEQLSFFNGTWKCTGTGEGTLTQKPSEVGDWWYEVQFQARAKAGPQLMSRSMLGYDAAKKQFVRMDFDRGGAHTQITSKGWEGDSWVWNGSISGPETSGPYRQTLTRTAANQFTAKSELNGKPLIEMTCTRAR